MAGSLQHQVTASNVGWRVTASMNNSNGGQEEEKKNQAPNGGGEGKLQHLVTFIQFYCSKRALVRFSKKPTRGSVSLKCNCLNVFLMKHARIESPSKKEGFPKEVFDCMGVCVCVCVSVQVVTAQTIPPWYVLCIVMRLVFAPHFFASTTNWISLSCLSSEFSFMEGLFLWGPFTEIRILCWRKTLKCLWIFSI